VTRCDVSRFSNERERVGTWMALALAEEFGSSAGYHVGHPTGRRRWRMETRVTSSVAAYLIAAQ
jgi:hypothetical protein